MNIGSSDFTLETWIQTTGMGAIASFGGAAYSSIGGEMLLLITSEYGALGFLVATIQQSNPGPVTRFLFGATPINDGEWHHIAAVRWGPQLILYVDGEWAGGSPFPTQPSGVSVNLQQPFAMWVGNAYPNPDNLFKPPFQLAAAYDEMRLWSMALTEEQVNDAMHHQLTDSEPGLLGHWKFDQNLNDSSPSHNNMTAQGTVSYLPSPIDFQPEGEPYLVTQAQLMQDWVPDTSSPGSFTEISGYRVVIAAHDGDGNAISSNIQIWVAYPEDTAELVFLDGSTAQLTASNSVTKSTDTNGELSFVIDSQGQLMCPPLKVNADFMAESERLVISPDRHVHATLAAVTADQLTGAAPLASGKTATLNMPGDPSSGQINAVAQAVSQAMSAVLDHNLQPERPTTRTRDLPEDVPVTPPYAARYQKLDSIVEPYHFASNTMTTHFLSVDAAIARLLVPEDMPNPDWMLDYGYGQFSTAPGMPSLETVTYNDKISQLFQGQSSVTVPAATWLAAMQAEDTMGSLQQRWFGDFFAAVKAAATVVVNTVTATIEETGEAISAVIVTAVDAVGNAVRSALATIEDAIEFVGAILAKVGAAIVDIVNFVQAIFDFDDIRQTAQVIQSVLTQAPGVVDAMLTAVETKVDNALTAFQNYVDGQLTQDINSLGAAASLNGQSGGAKSSPPPDIQSKYMTSLYAANAQQASDPGNAMQFSPSSAFSTAWSAQFNAGSLNGVQSALTATQPAVLTSPDALLDAGFADLLSALKTTFDAFMSLIQNAVSGVIDLLGDAVDAVFAVVSARIEIPYLTDFYENVVMAGQGTFSMLGLASLIAGAGFTIMYKLISGQTGPVFSAAEIGEITGDGYLTGVYNASALAQLLSSGTPKATVATVTSPAPALRAATVPVGQAFVLRSPAAGQTSPAPPSTWQKVQWAMNLAYAASTALWGVGCTWEDAEGVNVKEPGPDGPMSMSTKIKMGGQVLAFISGFPIFFLPPEPSTVVSSLAGALYMGDMLELASNVLACGSNVYAFSVDPLFTGAVGVAQLIGGIWYTIALGGDAATIAMDAVSNVCQSFEWIPQLLKYFPAGKPFVPLLDAVAYAGVTAVTALSVGYSMGQSMQPSGLAQPA
jgi:hypothetical protein